MEDSKMHKPSSQTQTKLLIALALGTLTSCGDNNPYKDKDKRCKLNCENQDAVKRAAETFPRKDPALPLALNYWDANSPRSVFELATQVQLASKNPFFVAFGALQSMGNNAKTARDMVGSKDAWKNCIGTQFVNAPKALGEGLEWSADFGKCQPLAQFDADAENERKKALAKGEALPFTTFLGFEQGFRFAVLNPSSLNQSSLNLIESTQKSAQLDQNILFSPTTSKDFSCTETECSPLAITFATGESKLFKLMIKGEKEEKRSVASWTAGGFSSDPAKALRSQYTENGQTLVLNGSVYTTLAVTKNPVNGQLFQGEVSNGYSLEFQFLDFKMKGTAPRLGTTLGFDKSVALSGVYYIFLNQPLDPAAPNGFKGSAVFAAVGRGEPCLVNLFQVKGPDAVEAIKVLDLCKSFE
jgi:hypothetical protein